MKVSFFAFKYVFYRPVYNAKRTEELNFEALEIQKWNIPTGWTNDISEHCKNWTIELDIKLCTVSKR